MGENGHKFQEFPKIPRLMREIVVTEKIDGTNAQVRICSIADAEADGLGMNGRAIATKDGEMMLCGSRNRYLTLNKDNFNFARWVADHSDELWALGLGTHYGEWWGCGIQRGYGLSEKRWSLFNVSRWSDRELRPACCDVVPVLYQGMFSLNAIEESLVNLSLSGSRAALGFMEPEGVVVFHTALNGYFKRTIENDETHKGGQRG